MKIEEIIEQVIALVEKGQIEEATNAGYKILENCFRANVGIVIFNSKGRVLAFKRKPKKGEPKIARPWQFPQGGVDGKEKLKAAIERETLEETGIKAKKDLIYKGEYPLWLGYELKKKIRIKKKYLGRGQAQKWFFYQVKNDNLKINLNKAKDDEFCDYRWIKMKKLVKIVVDFRRPIYAELGTFLKNL